MVDSELPCDFKVKLSTQRPSGVHIEVETKCDSWENVQKFLNEFQDTVIKGNKMRL